MCRDERQREIEPPYSNTTKREREKEPGRECGKCGNAGRNGQAVAERRAACEQGLVEQL